MALTLAAVQFLSVLSYADEEEAAFQTSVSVQDQEEVSYDEVQIERKTSTEEHTLTAILDNDRYSADKPISVKFDCSDMVDYSYVADGVLVSNEDTDSMRFEFWADNGFGSLDIYAECSDREIVKQSVYTYKNGDDVYVSSVGKDVAWHNYMEDQFNRGQITMEE